MNEKGDRNNSKRLVWVVMVFRRVGGPLNLGVAVWLMEASKQLVQVRRHGGRVGDWGRKLQTVVEVETHQKVRGILLDFIIVSVTFMSNAYTQ